MQHARVVVRVRLRGPVTHELPVFAAVTRRLGGRQAVGLPLQAAHQDSGAGVPGPRVAHPGAPQPAAGGRLLVDAWLGRGQVC